MNTRAPSSPLQGVPLQTAEPAADSKWPHRLTGWAMAALWGLFVYRHLLAFHKTGDWTYLLLCASETLTAGLFVLRSAPATVSKDPLDWLFGIAGTFTALLFVPAAWGVLPPARALVVVGTALQIFGLVSLNRSLAIVAAKRDIKTGGLYRFVRHPLYASYLLILTGYIGVNTSAWNLALYVMTLGFLWVRMLREEKHLALDPQYAAYMQQVKYRVIPFVF